MDFADQEDFDTPLLIIAIALAPVMMATGIAFFPSRLGYNAWRRSRRNAAGPQLIEGVPARVERARI